MMKKHSFVICVLMFLAGIFCKVDAREVTLFNDGWEFKKGPFSKEAMQAAVKWNAGWQEVTLPHTWNADDMQKKVSVFYEGVGYYRKSVPFPKA